MDRSSQKPDAAGLTTRKGIVLAGGTGTRMYPLTSVVNKQLMPVFDKPLVYYPITALMLAGIRQILVITAPGGESQFKALLGNGSDWGIHIEYAIQPRPQGIAQALSIAEGFLSRSPSALILGDNIFYGNNLAGILRRADQRRSGATIFGYQVENPKAYGVLSLDGDGRPIGIVEKPESPPSDYAVTGLYFFDEKVGDLAAQLVPSKRGELEITDLNRLYLERGALNVEFLGRGFAWLDAGSPESLLAASNFVRTLELRQGLKVGCPEEVAYRMGFIDHDQLDRLIDSIGDNPYSSYLRRVSAEPVWEAKKGSASSSDNSPR